MSVQGWIGRMSRRGGTGFQEESNELSKAVLAKITSRAASNGIPYRDNTNACIENWMADELM